MASRLSRAAGALAGAIAGITALSLVPAGAATASSRQAGPAGSTRQAGTAGSTRQAGRRTPARPSQPAARPDASVPCGAFCASYFTEKYGPEFVLNDFRGRQATGTRVTLRYASNSDPAEDWSIWPTGTVRQLAAFGIVSRALALHYGADQAFEAEFAPYGTPTGLCAGLAGGAASGESVTLQWCGQSGKTVWVTDAADQAGNYAPLINGSDRNFSDPQVLTEPGWPTRWPRPQLISDRLQKFADGTVYDDQMWDNTTGVLP
ncbi:MAG: hypothetical protein ABSB01_08340 [Streptosporangiaceae bacterium]|jgi:hypothetical protein